ncbi:hypothetical protein MYX06_04725 [Patescibacteria group bacterium AH-259-L05]|nr:hypothetical protein [Patescibacteria group bacterium AH-259-L05]
MFVLGTKIISAITLFIVVAVGSVLIFKSLKTPLEVSQKIETKIQPQPVEDVLPQEPMALNGVIIPAEESIESPTEPERETPQEPIVIPSPVGIPQPRPEGAPLQAEKPIVKETLKKVATPEIPDQVSPKKTATVIEEKAQEQLEQPMKKTDLTQQFNALEKELLESKTRGSYLAPEHTTRIQNDLLKLENEGYQVDEIERLRQLVLELSPHLQDQEKQEATALPDPKTCTNTDPVLTADITDFSNIRRITAPGSPSFEGPKGHSFIWTEHERIPVYAPIDAILENGAYYTGGDDATQYILTFRIKNICDFVFKFDHIDEPVDSIRNVFPLTPRPTEDTRGEAPATEIPFSAGDLIGYTRGTRQAGNWDFGLYNMAEKGPLADSYGMHSNAVCWVDFYSPEKQTQYRNLLEGPKLACSF